MRWFFALVFPPLALLLCGKPFQMVLSFALCLFFWLPGVIHALLVVRDYQAQHSAAGANVRIS